MAPKFANPHLVLQQVRQVIETSSKIWVVGAVGLLHDLDRSAIEPIRLSIFTLKYEPENMYLPFQNLIIDSYCRLKKPQGGRDRVRSHL